MSRYLLIILTLFLSLPSIIFSDGKWENIDFVQPSAKINKIVIDSKDNIYALLNKGIVYSSNCGETWDSLNCPDKNIQDIFIGPNDSLYITVWKSVFCTHLNDINHKWHLKYKKKNNPKYFEYSADGVFYCIGEFGVRYFEKKKKKWKKINKGLDKKYYSNLSHIAINSKNEIFLCESSASTTIYKFKSKNKKWIEILNIPFRKTVDFLIDENDILYLAMKPKKDYLARLYGLKSDDHKSSPQIAISKDNGLNWEFNDLKSYDDINCYVALNQDKFLLNDGEHSFFTEDGGFTWKRFNVANSNYNIQNIYFNSKNSIYITTITGQIFKHDNKTNSWNKIHTIRKTGYLPVYLRDDYFTIDTLDNLYVANGHILKSSDDGTKWRNVDELRGTSQSKNLSPSFHEMKIIDSNSKDNIFIASDSKQLTSMKKFGHSTLIFRSVDHGIEWIKADNGIEAERIDDLFIDRFDNIYAYTKDKNYSNKCIYLSTNNGFNWSKLLSKNQDGKIFPYKFIISHDSTVYAIYKGSLYQSTEFLNNWSDIKFKKINYNLDDKINVQTILEDRIGKIFIGTSNGIFLFNNKENIWQSVNNGLSNLNISLIQIDNFNNLYCADNKGSIYKYVETNN